MNTTRILTGAALIFLTALHIPGVQAASGGTGGSHATPRAIFAGTDNGAIYQSTNGGRTWQESDKGLAGGPVYPLVAGAGATLYAAPGDSGVYSSTDGGRTWQDDNGVNGPESHAIYGLAVDPGDGERVYAIDNAGNFYRSDDSGGHWTASPAPLSNFSDSSADALQVDPLRPSTMLIASDTGMAISTDAGVSWSMAPGMDGLNVYQAVFSGANPDVAYAATSNGIFQTINGGQTWQQEKRGIPAGTSLAVVAVDPANAARIIAYSNGGDIYRSTDGGTSWRRVASTGADVASLAYDPAHPGTVLAGSRAGMLWTSTDNGISWHESNPHLGTGSIDSLAGAVRQALPTDTVTPPAPGTPNVYYATATHHLISGPFLAFYTHNGGLRLFGLPLTEAFYEHGHAVQFFERAEFIWQNGHIMLGHLGTARAQQRHFAPAPPSQNTVTHLYFPSTGHSLSGTFLTFWQTHGGSAIIGLPVSEPVYQTNGDGTGRVYLVQYFQNLRLEYHPELSGSSYEVSVGQLGREALQQRGWL
jgi:photosystem II stability/assembly factor-like uncharacterized protein